MARIESIRQRLRNWAAWAIKRDSGGMGYPTINILAKQMGGGHSDGIPVNDVEAAETDSAVQSFKYTRSHLYLVLTLHYIGNLQLKEVALRMGRAESTVKRNLEDADAAIRDWLVEQTEKRRVS